MSNWKERFIEGLELAKRRHANKPYDAQYPEAIIPPQVFDRLVAIAESKSWIPQLLDVLPLDLEYAPDWWLRSEAKTPTAYSYVTTSSYIVSKQELRSKYDLCRDALKSSRTLELV